MTPNSMGRGGPVEKTDLTVDRTAGAERRGDDEHAGGHAWQADGRRRRVRG